MPARPEIFALALLLGTATLAGAKPKGKPTKVVLPPNAPPVISTTHRMPPYREAQQRLARFITALQTGKRQRAVTFFSSRVPATDRQAFVTGTWLKREPRSSNFTQALFMRDLQITNKGLIKGDEVRLLVVPRDIPFAGAKPRKSGNRPQLGALVVPMRYEYGKWFVEMRKDRTNS